MTTALDSSLTGTNHNSLLSVATNQFASFCIDNRMRQGTMIVSVKVAKFEIKTLFFFVYFNSLLYKTNRFHAGRPCVCSVIEDRGRQNVARTSVSCASCATFLFLPHFDVICDQLLNRRTAT